jgi:hypothetical protein
MLDCRSAFNVGFSCWGAGPRRQLTVSQRGPRRMLVEYVHVPR